jgi:hypothetical protein
MTMPRTYTRQQQRRNDRIAYVLAVLFAVACVTVSLWIVGRAFDHMTDPCRTDAQRAVVPACK